MNLIIWAHIENVWEKFIKNINATKQILCWDPDLTVKRPKLSHSWGLIYLEQEHFSSNIISWLWRLRRETHSVMRTESRDGSFNEWSWKHVSRELLALRCCWQAHTCMKRVTSFSWWILKCFLTVRNKWEMGGGVCVCCTHNHKCPCWTPSEVLVSEFKIKDPDTIKHKLTFKK